jgi:hypothetical protein
VGAILDLIEKNHPYLSAIKHTAQRALDDGVINNASIFGDANKYGGNATIHFDGNIIALEINGEFSIDEACYLKKTIMTELPAAFSDKPFTINLTWDEEPQTINIIPNDMDEVFGYAQIKANEFKQAFETLQLQLKHFDTHFGGKYSIRDLLGDDADKIAKAVLGNRSDMVWSAEDVQIVVPDLTKEQANDLLDYVCRYQDAGAGITCETFTINADNISPEIQESAEMTFTLDGEQTTINCLVSRRSGDIYATPSEYGIDGSEIEDAVIRLKGSLVEVPCENWDYVGDSDVLRDWTKKLEAEKKTR